MPSQETFASANSGDQVFEVIKTYDGAFAREAFAQMDEEALHFLNESLKLDAGHDAPIEVEADALWEEIEQAAREDWNTFSYFVVTNSSKREIGKCLFVSADWPTAERFMRQVLNLAASTGAS